MDPLIKRQTAFVHSQGNQDAFYGMRAPLQRTAADSDYRMLPISGAAGFALIDAGDIERVQGHRWHLRRDGYAQACVYSQAKNIHVLLHRFILLGLTPGGIVDHRNRDRLDCRRQNLRFATASLNQANSQRRFKQKTSAYRGVCWCRDRWKAAISGVSLGYFQSEIEAAFCYDRAAVARFGEFARPNFP